MTDQKQREGLYMFLHLLKEVRHSLRFVGVVLIQLLCDEPIIIK